MQLQGFTLSFSVGAGQEYVRLRAASDTFILDLGARKHNFLLLTLAKQRLIDTAEGFAETTCGWIYVEDLEHDPSMAPERLNVDVFRLRRHFESRGVVDGVNVIERRASSRQIRIGTGRLKIDSL
ncbi:MAG: hypothetical protein ABSC94_31640 [Polyangiaceae bacterium]|jgi:hypothetical protein